MRGLEDATITLINYVLKHLEGSKTHAKLLSVDFSSEVNCIQPLSRGFCPILILILTYSTVVSWLIDFNQPNSKGESQRFPIWHSILLGVCLFPLLLVLCTDDHDSRHTITFADDSVIGSHLPDEEVSHGPVVEYVGWGDRSF